MPKGYGLFIGLNAVDPHHYSGWDGKLLAAENDARDMEQLARNEGFETKILLGKEATLSAVKTAIDDAAKSVKSGDIFLLIYSGHGGQLPDRDSDEADGQDETMCLFDAEMMDNELRVTWPDFKEDVRVLMFADSCHSETLAKYMIRSDRFAGMYNLLAQPPSLTSTSMVKAMPSEIKYNTVARNKKHYDKYIAEVDKKKKLFKDGPEAATLATVQLFSGCQDNQTSMDGIYNGVFTAKVKEVWNNGKFKGDYALFQKKIAAGMSPDQSPCRTIFGKQNPAYTSQSPFII